MKAVVYCALGIAGSGVVLALALYFYTFGSFGFGNQEAFALFGDFMGGLLNPILGFATILILLRSLWLQNEEMKATRKELEYTRNEMAATRQVHTNDLELQSRNHLRPQLEAVFKESKTEFNGAWNTPQPLFNVLSNGLESSSFHEIRLKMKKISGSSLYDAWERPQNRYAAYQIRRLFSALLQSAVALVEYSDTSLETDEVRRILVDARQRMIDLDLQDEVRLTEELGILDAAIMDRKGKVFPKFHQAINS